MFILIRLVLLVSVSILLFWIVSKSKINKKKMLYVILMLLSFALITFLSICPPENYVISFDSPKEVFDYTMSGDINDVVYGSKSCMIVYTGANDNTGYSIIPKTYSNYLIPNSLKQNTIINSSDENGIFNIITYSDTEDYYLFGSIITDKKIIDIHDSNQSELKYIDIEMGKTGSKTVYIYGAISDFSDEYYLLINNERIDIV